MASVTARINEYKQPRGGFIKPSDMIVEQLNDGIVLNIDENVHASIVGMAVDYLTRYMVGAELEDAFSISLYGSTIADDYGVKGAFTAAKKMLGRIKGLDDESIANACKLVTFDVWFRNTHGAMFAKTYKDTNPDKATIENIRTMVNRSLAFFEKYGPITQDGFTFNPINGKESDYEKWCATKNGSWGGYTKTVNTGDGDFLTKDTLWDFKVTVSEPTNKHTLQLLMYWVMGQHSGQKVFKDITKVGIFNPRLNRVYLFNINKLPAEVITVVEKDIICY